MLFLSFFKKKNQQFITWSLAADYDNYFVVTKRKRKRKEEKPNKRKVL